MASITLNNERFTHLLTLYELLSKQSLPDMQCFCAAKLLLAFNNNHKLVAQILFHGMHHLLYKIDINTINKMKNDLFNTQNNTNIKKKIDKNDTNSQNKKDEYIIPKFTDIPPDVMSFSICQYLDLNTLLSFEKVSKLLFTRSRNARIHTFELNLSKFYTFNNISYDLLRFKNTTKLSLLINDRDDYDHPYNIEDTVEWGSQPFQPDPYIKDNTYQKIAIMFKRFIKKSNTQRSNSASTLKVPIKSERNKIFQQLSQFYNLSHLSIKRNRKIVWGSANRNFAHSDIINSIINNLPSFDILRKLTILEITNIVSQCNHLMFSKLNVMNINKPIMITKLFLTEISMNITALNIMNNCMINLNEIHFDQVAIEIDDKHNINININNLLQRVSIICFHSIHGAVNTSKKTLSTHMLPKLLMIGDIKQCGTISIDNNHNNINNNSWNWNNNNDINNNDVKAVTDRKYLKTLHFHESYDSCLQSVNCSIGKLSQLTELCIDCQTASLCDVICELIDKCIMLQCLSLIINHTFLIPNTGFAANLRSEFDENDIKRFNRFCDSIFVNNTSIKHVRIKQNFWDWHALHVRNHQKEHVSSILVRHLIKYMKTISDWRKLESFQFLSKKRLSELFKPNHDQSWKFNISTQTETGTQRQKQEKNVTLKELFDGLGEDLILSNTQREIKEFDDLEEFYLLDTVSNIVTKECGITFSCINPGQFASNFTSLWKFCGEKFKIKLKYNDNCENGWGTQTMNMSIGKWNDSVHNDDIKQFDYWSVHCRHIHNISS